MPTPNNIQQTGPRTARQLQEMNSPIQEERDEMGFRKLPELNLGRPDNPYANATQDVASPFLDGKGDYWGRSRFDRRNPLIDDEGLAQLPDSRANEQSTFNKLLNGTIKMATTAGTTFLDGTVGFVFGLGQGFSNLVDSDDDTSFWNGLWNNDFNKAMASAQEAMEKIAPNYYTQKELDNPWYKNVWTANFWGDKFLKNMGFTIGTMATMATGIGDLGAIAGGGVELLGKAIASGKLLKATKFGNTLMRGAERAGGIAQKLVNTAISANAEASIEAINAVRANNDAFEANLNIWKQERVAEANNWLYENQGSPNARQEYMRMLQSIDSATEQAIKENADTASGLGNSVWGMNMALLSLTNNLEFGKYIKGGYNQSQSISKMKMLLDGAATTDVKAFGRALADGTKKAVFGADETLKKMTAGKVGRIIGGTVARNFEEGFEEGAQNLISDSGQMQAQAVVNTKLKDWASKRDEDKLFIHAINPDVRDELTSRTKAFMNAWQENFGTIASPGWEEVFLGALTGGLGTLGFKADKATSKIKPTWAGGFIEEYRKTQEEYGQQELLAEQLNKVLNDDKFRATLSHAAASLSLAESMEDALQNNDILRFKNREMMDVAENALFWREMGGLEMFRSFYEAMAERVSDEDINSIKGSFRDVETGKSYFDGLSNEEIRSRMQGKAKSTLDKIDSVIESYDWHQRQYGDKIAEVAPNKRMAESALKTIVSLDTLVKDLQRRKAAVEQKQQLSQDDEGQAEEAKVNYKSEINAIDRSIKQVKDDYNKYINNPQALFDDITKAVMLNRKREIGKNAQAAKARFETAKSILDVADAYYNTDPNTRQQIFDEVYENAEPELKKNLDSFKGYLATTQALPTIVNNKLQAIKDGAAASGVEFSDKAARNYQNTITDFLDEIVEQVATNPSETFTDPKKAITNGINAKASQLRDASKNEKVDKTYSQLLSMYADELEDIGKQLGTYNTVYQAFQKPAAPKVSKEEKVEQPAKPTEKPAEEAPYGPVVETYETKNGTVEVRTKVTEKDGIKTTKVVSIRNGREIGTRDSIPIPEEFKIAEDQLPEDTEIIGMSELREATDGSGKAGATLSVKYDGAYSQADVKLERVTLPVKNPSEVQSSPQGGKKESEKPKEDTEKKTVETSKPVNEASAEKETVSTEEEQPSDQTSMRGTSFLRYKINGDRVATEMSKGNTSTYLFQQVAQAEGIDIDFIQNNYLYKLLQLPEFKGEDGQSRIPVRYVKFNREAGNGGLNRFVFLATPYTDSVKNVFPAKDVAKLRTITVDGQEYLIIGSLGTYHDENAKEMTYNEERFEEIEHALSEQVKQNPDAPFQMLASGENGENTNYIYQVNGGTIIRSVSGDGGQSKTLKELLENPESNPQHLQASDLAFNVIMGSKENGYTENTVNTKEGEDYKPLKGNISAGQVYVYIKDSTGSWIPWMLDTVGFDDIEALPDDNPIKKEVFNLIHHLAEVLADHSYSEDVLKERLIAINQLKEALIFGSPEVGGTTIKYTEPGEVDELGLRTGDTLEAFIAGQPLETTTTQDGRQISMPFQLMGQTAPIIEAKLLDMIRALAPNYNIKVSTLRQPGGAASLVEAGVLKAPLRVLGAVNARSYVYPIKTDGTPDVTFSVAKSSDGLAQNNSGIQRVWLGNSEYKVTQSGDIIDAKTDKLVTDPDLIQMYNDVKSLTPDNATFTHYKAPYWIVGERAYTSDKKGRFKSVDPATAHEYYKNYQKRKATEERKKAAQEALDKKKETPVSEQKPAGTPVESTPASSKLTPQDIITLWKEKDQTSADKGKPGRKEIMEAIYEANPELNDYNGHDGYLRSAIDKVYELAMQYPDLEISKRILEMANHSGNVVISSEVSDKNAIFVREIADAGKKIASAEQQKFFNTLPGASDFLELLNIELWDVSKYEILAFMVGQKLGVDPIDLTNKQIEDTLWNSKYHDSLAWATDENIEEVTDQIIKCGL